jgi:citrate lyase subunit beta/citryl-CoA lyase
MPPPGFYAEAAALMLRSLLFVPADSERKIARALSSSADAIILDLEDSVALADKPRARSIAAAALKNERTRTVFVRINALETGLASADLEAVLRSRPGIMLPKSESAASVNDLYRLMMAYDPEAGALPVIAIATETAQALFGLGTYRNAHTGLVGLTWGMEDLMAALGAAANRGEDGRPTETFRLARTLCLAGARAAGLEAIDTVHTNFRDLEGFESEAKDAARDGFTGKLCIHPDQVEIANAAFTPSPQAIAHARAVIDAFVTAGNSGVIALDGQMLDVPHLKAARSLLARVPPQS